MQIFLCYFLKSTDFSWFLDGRRRRFLRRVVCVYVENVQRNKKKMVKLFCLKDETLLAHILAHHANKDGQKDARLHGMQSHQGKGYVVDCVLEPLYYIFR